MTTQQSTTDQDKEAPFGYFGFKLQTGEEIIGIAEVAKIRAAHAMLYGTANKKEETFSKIIPIKSPFKYYVNEQGSPVFVEGVAQATGNLLFIRTDSLVALPTSIQSDAVIVAYDQKRQLLEAVANDSNMH